ncbi:MAG: ABC transporter substrate-binding protein [Nitrososphaerales archaeon]
MAEKVSRRRFLVAGGAAAISAVVFGVAGYYIGSTSVPPVKETVTRTLTQTVTERATTTVTAAGATTTITAPGATTTVTAPPVTSTVTVTQTVTTTATTVATPKLSRVIIAWPFEIVTLHPYKFSRNMPSESPMDAIYDRFLSQDINLKIQPGVIEKYEWSPDKSRLDLTVRRGIKFHDGTDLTAEDVAYSLEVMKTGAYGAAVWANLDPIEVASPTLVKATLKKYDPSLIAWLTFLDAFVIPKAYWEKVGPDEFAKKPIGSGPYKVKSYKPGLLELTAFEDYWRGAPVIKEVVFKEVLDPRSRAVEVEAGTSDFTIAVDVADYDRLAALPHLSGKKAFVTDVAILMIPTYYPETGDENVRLAMHYAIDKEALVRDVLLGFGRPVSTTEAPGYMAYDPNYVFPYDPAKAKELLAKSGYSTEKPVKITAATLKGNIPRDYEVMQAIVAMWKKVGIEASLEVITLAQHFEMRNTGKMKHVHLYPWSNATGDPVNSVGHSQWPNAPFSTWRGLKAANLTDYSGLMQQATDIIAPVFTEKDESLRIEKAKEAAKWVVEHGLVIPLYQLATPYLMKKEITYEPWPQGFVRPYYMRA